MVMVALVVVEDTSREDLDIRVTTKEDLILVQTQQGVAMQVAIKVDINKVATDATLDMATIEVDTKAITKVEDTMDTTRSTLRTQQNDAVVCLLISVVSQESITRQWKVGTYITKTLGLTVGHRAPMKSMTVITMSSKSER